MTNKKYYLSAQERKVFGRKVSGLRKQGILPANIFGKKITSQSIQILGKDFVKVFDEAGETGLINLAVNEKDSRPVLVSAVQYHPVTNAILHVDFHQVDLKEKVTATVPLEIVGESPAVKEKGALLLRPVSEIAVEALPADIPSSFTLDVSGLVEIGDSLHVKDLQVDSGKITIQLSADEPLVLVQEPKVVEEPAEEVAPVEGGAETPASQEESTDSAKE